MYCEALEPLLSPLVSQDDLSELYLSSMKRYEASLSCRDGGRENGETFVQPLTEVSGLSHELPDAASCVLAAVGDPIAVDREGDT